MLTQYVSVTTAEAGVFPTRAFFNYSSNTGQNDIVNIVDPVVGTYVIGVYAYSTCAFSITATTSSSTTYLEDGVPISLRRSALSSSLYALSRGVLP